ncbi:Rne/Rng family ribonuclease [Brevibacterium sp. XM4083]|uniref:Rne/Rng family ribonuclease n=1 Tax=Brevibacterium sp. XM4083 TaxID=2583238 RepID=UPI00202F7874|nr:Rne/Rng family ribonuclease [Brevibacterium sp. XM4083]MCM1012220.1 Rne/Rng family ribonuclease [Brevibacterium sp. XM4083]
MSDSTNDSNGTADPTEGILADLADLQANAAAAKGAEHTVDDDVREELDHLADAAGSLRESPERDDEDRERGRRRPKRARDAVANRGLVFEQFVRETDEGLDPSAEDDEDESTPQPPQAPAFDPRNPFAAPAAPAPVEPASRPAAAVPQHGGLIFQVPKAELAETVSIDDDFDDEDFDEDETDDRDDREDRDDRDDEGGSRRRRRGGRGRRSRSRDDDESEAQSSRSEKSREKPAEKSAEKDSETADGDERPARANRRGDKAEKKSDDDARDKTSESDDDGDDEDGGSRRRRRRRSRSRGSDSDEVTSLKGSTRLEAKRQRRKEGREAGRRRPVITEAEFLARRESVDRTMLVRENGDQTQLVVVEDGIAVEHYLKENRQQSSLIGNVYLGKVQNVLPSMEAAFVDIGKGRNAVLYAGEVNWDALGMDGKARRIEAALSPGDSVLVQVTKDPVGHKGARLTSQISLPGRFLVYVPGNSMTGISRKLPDVERARLKKLLKELVGDSNGVIVRTAAEGATDKELSRDVERLAKRWETIEKKSKSTKVLAPQLLYSEPDMIVRIIRDVFNEDFNSLVIDGDGAWNTIHEYVEAVAPDLLERVHRYSEDEGIFDHYRIEEQIQKALQRQVNLPSGGSLVIDRTEAMTVIDVNTGKFTGAGGNLEETVTRNNLEAAEEVIRQLRLRDIGGIIVVDFIDMVLESNRDLVVRRLVECLGRDRTKHQVAEVTSLGLVQMTRKRIGTGLAESMVSAGADLTGRGLLLPGSEEDGSKAHRGNRSQNSESSGNGKRDRKRRSSKNSESESQSESVGNDASRSAVAAIAKATLKKDDDAEAADAQTDTGAADTTPEEKPSRAKSRGRKRTKSTDRSAEAGRGDTDTQDEKPSTGEEQPMLPVESEPETTAPAADAPAAAEASPEAEPAGEMPLMIGADTTTKVAVAAEPEAPRRKAPAKKDKPAEKPQEALPTSFVIIGED